MKILRVTDVESHRTEQLRRQFDAFFAAIAAQNLTPPQNLAEAIKGLPPPGSLPKPWTTWTLLHLFVHRAEQQAVQAMLRERLPEIFPPSDAMRAEGLCYFDVPGMPEHYVEVDCRWYDASLVDCNTSQTTYFGVRSGFEESPIFYRDFFPKQEPDDRWEPAGRVRELHPTVKTINFAVGDLTDGACLVFAIEDDGEEHYHFEPYAADHTDRVADFLRAWHQPENRLWLAALIGDWMLAAELAEGTEDPRLIAVIRERAAFQQRHLKRLTEVYNALMACEAELG